MDKNLKNALIIIAVLVGVYYFVSPYENCVRDYKLTVDKSWHEPKYKARLNVQAQNSCSRISW